MSSCRGRARPALNFPSNGRPPYTRGPGMPSPYYLLVGKCVIINLIEKTCWQSVAAELELDQGTVGTALTLAHTAPTPVGMVVQCDCELTAVEDRRLCFTARVYDDVTEVATATHERYIVDNERFTRKANSKLTAK